MKEETKLIYPTDSRRQATHMELPVYIESKGQFAKGACLYCLHRPLPKSDTPDSEKWWYGTGNGDHNPYRCRAFIRYLVEGGGGRSKGFPDGHAPWLRRCVYICPSKGKRARQ